MTIICFDAAIATCEVSRERTSQMKKLNTDLLKASKMYSIPTKIALHCSAQCLNEPDCIYITRNDAETNCTLYTTGSTNYVVSEFVTFVVQFKTIQVIDMFR